MTKISDRIRILMITLTLFTLGAMNCQRAIAINEINENRANSSFALVKGTQKAIQFKCDSSESTFNNTLNWVESRDRNALEASCIRTTLLGTFSALASHAFPVLCPLLGSASFGVPITMLCKSPPANTSAIELVPDEPILDEKFSNHENCPNCQRVFSEPRQDGVVVLVAKLPCGHAYCKECLEELMNDSFNGNIEKPIVVKCLKCNSETIIHPDSEKIELHKAVPVDSELYEFSQSVNQDRHQ